MFLQARRFTEQVDGNLGQLAVAAVHTSRRITQVSQALLDFPYGFALGAVMNGTVFIDQVTG